MTILEAMAQQPAWVRIWMNLLAVGALGLPLVLLAWRATRVAGIVVLVCSVLAAAGAWALYQVMGYTRLLGAPHIPFWGFAVCYLWQVQQRAEVGRTARAVMWAIMVLLAISLAFDVADTLRWISGERSMSFGPA